MTSPNHQSSRMRLGVLAFIVFLPLFIWLLVPSARTPFAVRGAC